MPGPVCARTVPFIRCEEDPTATSSSSVEVVLFVPAPYRVPGRPGRTAIVTFNVHVGHDGTSPIVLRART